MLEQREMKSKIQSVLFFRSCSRCLWCFYVKFLVFVFWWMPKPIQIQKYFFVIPHSKFLCTGDITTGTNQSRIFHLTHHHHILTSHHHRHQQQQYTNSRVIDFDKRRKNTLIRHQPTLLTLDRECVLASTSILLLLLL